MPDEKTPETRAGGAAVGAPPIQGVPTSVAAFIGATKQTSPPVKVFSFGEFMQAGGAAASANLIVSVRGFFANGGQQAYISRVVETSPIDTALEALAKERISLLCCPDEMQFANAAEKMAAHCEKLRDRICVLQSPHPQIPTATHKPPVKSAFAAYYHPWVVTEGPAGDAPVPFPPSSHVMGVYAQTDATKGVWHAPAGMTVKDVTGLSQQIGDAEGTQLASLGINVLRHFVDQGNLIWGARTTSDDPQWKYVNIRRLMIFLEQSIDQGLQWVVFEPNAAPLWARVKDAVGAFLQGLWSEGAFLGTKPADAYFVRCDRTTMTQTDIDNGRLIIEVGVAPLKPAEFVIFRIGQWTKRPRDN